MGLHISTNAGAAAANYHLGKNSKSLEKSMARLASGLRIARPSDDAGGLAVSMKLKAAINRVERCRAKHSKWHILFGGTGTASWNRSVTSSTG